MVSKHYTLNPQRGAILLAMLFLVVLLSLIVLGFLDETLDKVKYRALNHQREDLRVEGFSLLDMSIALLEEYRQIDGALTTPEQGWGNPMDSVEVPLPEGVKAEIKIVDETGKLSLSGGRPEFFNVLFEEMGVGFSQARVLTDSLLDWIDADELARLNGAEADDYGEDTLGNPITPPNEQLRSFLALDRIKGFNESFFDEDGLPNEKHRQFTESVSFYHGHPINLNTAPPLIQAAIKQQGLFDFNVDAKNAYLGYASGSGDGEQTDTFCHVLKISISVWRGQSRYHLSAIVTPNESSSGLRNEPLFDSESEEVSENPEGSPTDEDEPADIVSTSNALQYPFRILVLQENFKI